MNQERLVEEDQKNHLWIYAGARVSVCVESKTAVFAR